MCDLPVLFHSEFLPLHFPCRGSLVFLPFLPVCLYMHVLSYAFYVCASANNLNFHLSPTTLVRPLSPETLQQLSSHEILRRKQTMCMCGIKQNERPEDLSTYLSTHFNCISVSLHYNRMNEGHQRQPSARHIE